MTYVADGNRYHTMTYRRCGKSGLQLPAVSLGLWQNFGGEAPLERSREMILGAFDMGITHFDLANNYGPPPGSAEETFGKVYEDNLRPYRDEIVVSTKAGYLMGPGPYGDWGSRKYLLSSLDQSLRRMRLPYVDIFYHHRPDPNTPLEESMGALASAVHQGKALYAGISNYGPEDTARAADILKGMGIPLLVHQPRYNMLDRRIENGLDKVLLEGGIGAVAFSPLAQGLLTEKYLHGIPADSRAGGSSVFLKPEAVTQETVEKARKLSQLAIQRGQTLAQLALNWVLENPAITSVIIGASRLAQIEENVRALESHTPLTQNEREEIAAILR